MVFFNTFELRKWIESCYRHITSDVAVRGNLWYLFLYRQPWPSLFAQLAYVLINSGFSSLLSFNWQVPFSAPWSFLKLKLNAYKDGVYIDDQQSFQTLMKTLVKVWDNFWYYIYFWLKYNRVILKNMSRTNHGLFLTYFSFSYS